MGTIDMESLTVWANQYLEKKEHKAAMDKCQAEMDRLEPALLDQLSAATITKVSIKQGTIFIKEKIYPKFLEDMTREDAIEAMRKDGLDDFLSVNYNTNSFAAFIRELHKENEPLPEHIGKVVQVSETFKLNLRK